MNVRLFVRLAFESLLGAALGFVLLWPAVLSILQNPPHHRPVVGLGAF